MTALKTVAQHSKKESAARSSATLATLLPHTPPVTLTHLPQPQPGGRNSSAPIPKLLSRADFVYGIMRAAASLATGGAADTVDAIEDALLEKIQPVGITVYT